MFETAELNHRIDKATYKKEEPKLREALLDAQFELSQGKAFPFVILIGGVDGAGKGETVNTLNAWMDPRHIHTHALGDPTDEELLHPPMWRFWRALPPKGKLGVFFGSWYTSPIVDRVMGRTKSAALDASIDEILRFERMLADEGALILKFWFHLSKKAQRKRLKALESDPKTRWRVTPEDWRRFKIYNRFREVSEHALRRTGVAHAPWIVVEGVDARYRNITVGRAILKALRDRLKRGQPAPVVSVPRSAPAADDRTVLNSLDLSVKLEKGAYGRELEKWQGELNLLVRNKKFQRRALVVVFEGNDAAGKGGTIRRICGALDARRYAIVPIAAPTDEERAQPYLWRFWRHIPRLGQVTIFDRSWYGRVLVERIEGFCREADWLRAYSEINDFESEMDRHGALVAKFWLAIDKGEQERRFKERDATGFKRFKLTPEDWRNRKKWDQYAAAVCDMVEHTSTEIAPWTLIEANDKFHARIKVVSTLCRRLERAL